jgi:hypothetical protein
MSRLKQRAAEQTTPLLVLEDHELRLRYIEAYIRDGYLDYQNKDVFLDKNLELGISSKKKRVGEQLTPILILEDHELRLRRIETYINSRKELKDETAHSHVDRVNLSETKPGSSTRESYENHPPNPDVSGPTKPGDVKKEITFILSRIGELLNQMR